MNERQDTSHADQLRQGLEHHRWRREHVQALAILKRAEVAILDHKAEILAHDAAIARHDEQIELGEAHADASPADELARFADAHRAGAERHAALIDAIHAIATHLPNGGSQ